MTPGALFRITRPRFWMYTAGPFLLGYMAGLPAPRDLRTPAFWLPFLYFLLPANLFLYGINDLFDVSTDELNRKKETHEHRLAERERGILIGLLIGVGVLDAIFLAVLSPTWWSLLIAFVLLSTFYSAPPLRFKARALLDSYSNVLYVIPGFLGYALTAGKLPPTPILIGAACWAAGMHAYSAIPDIVPDTQAGIQTTAVALGERRALLFVAANWLIFAVLITAQLGRIGLITFLYPLIPLAFYAWPEWSVERAYWWFPILNGIMGFLAFVALMSGGY